MQRICYMHNVTLTLSIWTTSNVSDVDTVLLSATCVNVCYMSDLITQRFASVQIQMQGAWQ